jgi:ABC-type proline/glycine betaine transport system substrate-binding protein
MIVPFLLFGLGAASACLTNADLGTYGITPADRNMDQLTVAYFNWESSRFASAICKILLRDAMGYEFKNYESFGGSGSLFNAMDDGTSKMDFVPEIWESSATDRMRPYTVTSNKLTRLGQMGYTATTGWYIPDYMLNQADVVHNSWKMQYYMTYNDQTVINSNALSALNITQFILDHPTLSTSMSAQPNEVFEAEHCKDGSMTCVDVLLMSSGWEPNFYQAQVVNLNLPFRLTYWGYSGMANLVKALYEAGEHFLFYAYMPDSLLSKVNGLSVTFPKPLDDCFANANTNNSLGLYSSINCDYPITQTIKVARTETFEHLAAEEAKTFLAQFQMSLTDVEFMFEELKNNYDWSISWDLENTELEEIACTWIKAHPNTWSSWIYNDYVYADTLSAEEIVMYCAASIICVLGIVFLGWKLGFMDGLESVLFDMMLVYIGKIVMDLFDLMSDTIAYFSAVNGNEKIALWFNVMYVIIVGASYVAGIFAIYQNFICAKEAFFTKQSVEKGEVGAEDMEKLRAKSSLWQGSRARPRVSDLQKEEALEDIWSQEELDFANKRINDCYVALAIAVSEDIPMLGLNMYLMFNYPDDMTTFVYVSLFLSIFFLGVRLNQFYKIVMYRKQAEYATKAHEIHHRQREIEQNMQKIVENHDNNKLAEPENIV